MFESVVRILLSVPVRVKVMGVVLGAVLLVGVGMLWRIHATWHEALRAEIREQARAFATNLAAQCASDIASGRLVEIQRRLDEARGFDRSVHSIELFDANGAVLARSPRSTAPDDPGSTPIHRSEAPIPGSPGATLRVGVGEGTIGQEAAWLTRQFALASGAIMIVTLVAAWGLTKLLARPIQDLVACVHAVRAGRRDVDVPVHARDEVGELAVAFNTMTAALRDEERQRQDLVRKVSAVAEDERKRLARELHDETGQALTSIIAGLAALQASEPAAPFHGRLGELRSLAERTLGCVQDVARALRPAALDDLGLDAALRRQCDTLGRRFDVAVEFQSIGWPESPRLPSETETVLYRIVQESLTNAVRHGQPRTIQVLLQQMPNRVLVVVEDDGHGFDANDWRRRCRENGRLGLLGIEERASLLGGNLRVESSPGSGTSLFVEVPLGSEQIDGTNPDLARG